QNKGSHKLQIPGPRSDRRFAGWGFATSPPSTAAGSVWPVMGKGLRSEAGWAGAASVVPTRLSIRIHGATAAQIAALRFARVELMIDLFVTVLVIGSFGRKHRFRPPFGGRSCLPNSRTLGLFGLPILSQEQLACYSS